jgi:hypothetical protein
MAYVKKADRVAKDPNEMDDVDLGIGAEAEPAEQDSGDIAALLANPALSKLIDAAVTARLARMGAPAAAPAGGEAFDKLAETLGRMFELNAMQQPGYIKPLPAAEVERRLSGKVEMDALLARYEELGTPPLWTIGEGGFFECANAWEGRPGARIRTYIPPPEDFKPENDEARAVHAAMMQWLGDKTPSIGEQVKQAMIDAKRPPLITGAPPVAQVSTLVEVVKEAPVDPARVRRSMGTLTPERHNVSLADRGGAPQGPSFVSAAIG